MDIFNYHPETGEFISTEPVEFDPREGLPLVPRYATLVTVIPVAIGNVAAFNGTMWETHVDNRGVVYDTSTAEAFSFEELGPLPSLYTPKVPTHNTVWDGTDWIDDIDKIRVTQKNAITNSFEQALALGFVTSTSIKMDATYGDITKLDGGIRLAVTLNQANMSIRDFDNVVVDVTLEVANTLLRDVGVNYQTLIQLKWSLQTEIDQAVSDKRAIEAITWI